jgi:hemerythrin-like domain-containing protein
MTEPFHVLRHEHRVIERGLRALDGICARLNCGHQVPPEALLEVVDFLRVYADDFHHGKEEANLFAMLDRRGVTRQGGLLARLVQEHDIERKLLTAMLCAIEDYSKAGPASKTGFVEAAYRYTRHLTGHMEIEEAGLFKLADEVLEEPDKVTLLRALNQDGDSSGLCSVDRYVQLASELEEKWAV